VNPLLFPPALIKRALDDLSAIGHAARRLPVLERELYARVDRITAQLDELLDEMQPIRHMARVRAELHAVRQAVEPVSGQLEELRGEVQPIQQLAQVRAGIEPLDDDMRSVRGSIDELEPLVERIGARLAGIDAKLDDMRGDLSPLGDLAEKFPGVGRR
jgi:chromosome segregation ATPase